MLKDNVNVGNLRNDSHEHGNVWMAEYTLHHNLVLNFVQQFVRQSRVENLLDGHRSAIEFAHMNRRKAALSNFITNLNIIYGYLPDAGDGWQPTRVDRDTGGGMRESLEILLLDLILQIFNVLNQFILFLPFLL